MLASAAEYLQNSNDHPTEFQLKDYIATLNQKSNASEEVVMKYVMQFAGGDGAPMVVWLSQFAAQMNASAKISEFFWDAL